MLERISVCGRPWSTINNDKRSPFCQTSEIQMTNPIRLGGDTRHGGQVITAYATIIGGYSVAPEVDESMTDLLGNVEQLPFYPKKFKILIWNTQ